MKKILIVINTLGRAGAETAMLEFLRKLDRTRFDISLYVMMGQGELSDNLPQDIRVLNRRLSSCSVWGKQGRLRLAKMVLASFFRNGNYFGKLAGLMKNFADMLKTGEIRLDKLCWPLVAEGAHRLEESFDLAIAWIEGGSAYYTAKHVKAEKKAAFIHIDYESAGYTPNMDQGCWEQFGRIFAISEEVRASFARVYPQYEKKTLVFPNIIDAERIRCRAEEPGGFSDDYDGVRLLTVGRLTYQKGYDIAIQAMSLLKKQGYKVRWYVLGEGEERKHLEKQIAALGLKKDFCLLGQAENPYPYYKQTDLYVHATRYEGKSLAIQEAQILGCVVIASDCPGNREQFINGRDGILCKLDPKEIADSIAVFLKDKTKRTVLKNAEEMKEIPWEKEFEQLIEFIERG